MAKRGTFKLGYVLSNIENWTDEGLPHCLQKVRFELQWVRNFGSQTLYPLILFSTPPHQGSVTKYSGPDVAPRSSRENIQYISDLSVLHTTTDRPQWTVLYDAVNTCAIAPKLTVLSTYNIIDIAVRTLYQ